MKTVIKLVTISTLAMGTLISCNDNRDSQPNSTDVAGNKPGHFGASSTDESSDKRSIQSTAQTDSANKAHEEYVRDSVKK